MSAPSELVIGSPPPAAAVVLRRVAIHGVAAEVIGPRILTRTADIVLKGFPEAAPGTPVDFQVVAKRVAGQRKTWTINSGDRRHPAGPGVSAAALWIEWLLTAELVKRWSNVVHVHAGLVATADQSALLIGRSGSGKSTTTVALALEGLDLYSDDVALVERGTLRPLCVPRPIKLDPKARRLLRPRGLAIPRGRWIGESIDRTVLPGLPPIEQPGPPLGAAIFFAEERRPRAELRRITNAEAVMRLILQSSSERFGDGGPSAGATELVNTVPCYELISGDVEGTVRTIRALLAR